MTMLFEDYLQEQLKDPAFRREWERQAPEFERIRRRIRKRIRKERQMKRERELAEAMRELAEAMRELAEKLPQAPLSPYPYYPSYPFWVQPWTPAPIITWTYTATTTNNE